MPDAARAAAPVIRPVPCLKDNYAYLIHAQGGREACVVDPSQAAPVAAALADAGLELRGILVTHHHADHVGGIADLVRGQASGAAPVWVAGHARDRGRIPHQTIEVDAPRGGFADCGIDATPLLGARLVAMHIPGHTRAAIAWGLAPPSGEDPPTDVFTGDTLFGAGCGRLFEGTPADMFASLGALAALPGACRLWFGHEYTANNLRFAAVIEPHNPDVGRRQAALAPVTTPTTVALERATNPFVRAGSVEELARRRAAKDKF